ncbi:cytochrome P450 18a1 [Cimex lectularius]|uniref:Cytochrome P450 n=1 Tax=Cimex lectularius TaxID=79782 RepID=A0A8I6RDS6_CIMLE|nr:cytochrome P450 18a1 [Cimex lectularius]
MFTTRLFELMAHWVDTRSFLVFALVLVVARLAIAFALRMSRLPPGPWGLPFVGYLPFLKADAHIQFERLAKKYGGVFSLKLGNQFVVVLSDYKIIRDTFKRDDCTGRPHTEFSTILQGYGIVNSDGKLWKDQRKFLHEKLRKFGMNYSGQGKYQMAARIMKEVEFFLRSLVKEKHTDTDLNPILCTSISNVVCTLLMSVRFDQKDAQFQRFMQLFEEGFRLFGSLSYANFFPIMRYLPGLQTVKKKIEKNRNETAAFFQQKVDSHRESFDRGNIRDLLDNYLLEIEDAKEAGNDSELFEGKQHDRQLQQIIADIFTAGMESTKTTLLWSIIYMLHEPEVAKKVQKELDDVVGRHRLPGLEDRPFLPYTEAAILETLRLSSVVPLGTTHSPKKDIKLEGYTIPANSHVIPLLYAVHMDPNLWDEPEAFKPERFLTAENKIFCPDYFLPFGVGRRMCLGAVLARLELFQFFASFMHTFHARVPEDCPPPSLRPNIGVTLTPEHFRVSLTQRPLQDSSLEFLNSAPGVRSVGAH